MKWKFLLCEWNEGKWKFSASVKLWNEAAKKFVYQWKLQKMFLSVLFWNEMKVLGFMCLICKLFVMQYANEMKGLCI